MLFRFLVAALALTLTSAAISLPILPGNETTGVLEWAAADFPLAGGSFALGLNEGGGKSLSDVWDLPAALLFCNKSSDSAIDHGYVTTLANGPYAGMANSALLRADGGQLWKITHHFGIHRGTQIYICNFGKYDVPFSVAEYNIIDGALNENRGDRGGWVLIVDWQLMLGRDATNDDGSFRFACGNSPLP